MRIAVVSDPHGCLIGLKAALHWLETRVDEIVCAGDVATFGPRPNECVALLAERGIATVQGNCDRDVLSPSAATRPTGERAAQIAAIHDWCAEKLTPASRRWLGMLPPRLMPAPGLVILHGGWDAPEEIVDANTRPSFPPGVSAVAAGHLHTPFVIYAEHGIWANAGSAGRPCDGDPRAAAVILEQQSEGWAASIHRIDFNVDAAVQAIHNSTIPHAGRLVETQRKACWW